MISLRTGLATIALALALTCIALHVTISHFDYQLLGKSMQPMRTSQSKNIILLVVLSLKSLGDSHSSYQYACKHRTIPITEYEDFQ